MTLKEIKAIRAKHARETKGMTKEERWAYYRKGVDEFQRQIDELRAQKALLNPKSNKRSNIDS